MNPMPELVAMIQQDRQRAVARDRLVRLVAAIRACCSPSMRDRITRALRLTPASL
jgi:hypothetical protein